MIPNTCERSSKPQVDPEAEGMLWPKSLRHSCEKVLLKLKQIKRKKKGTTEQAEPDATCRHRKGALRIRKQLLEAFSALVMIAQAPVL